MEVLDAEGCRAGAGTTIEASLETEQWTVEDLTLVKGGAGFDLEWGANPAEWYEVERAAHAGFGDPETLLVTSEQHAIVKVDPQERLQFFRVTGSRCP